MKLEITTSPKNVEMANYILAQAIKQLLERGPELLDITPADVEKAVAFRKSLLKAFLRPQIGKV